MFLKKKKFNKILFICLVGVSETTHTRHDTEDVVVGSVDTETVDSSGSRKSKSGSVYARHVEGTGRLVFFGFEGEGVHVNTSNSGDVGVVLVGLDESEVFTSTFSKSVVTVELKFGGVTSNVCSSRGGTVLLDPYKFFDGVVEVKFNSAGTRSDSFFTSELELFDEVFVAELSETTTFVSVKEDVVNP